MDFAFPSHVSGADVTIPERIDSMPLGRPRTVDEPAGAVYLFCIPESNYITGALVTCGGGYKIA